MPFREPTNPLFARFFPWGWNRLEGRSRRDDFASALSAATADPLWALGRQWQLLELRGDDAGTPIHVDLAYEVAPLTRIRLGARPSEEIGAMPVEVLVEREAVDWDWRMRVRAGQHFERLVRLDPTLDPAALIASLRVACPIARPPADSDEWAELDYAARRFVALMEGRVIDGKELLRQIEAGTAPQGVTSELRTKFTEWYEALYSQASDRTDRTSPAWQPEQLDYDFRVHATDAGLPGPLHAGSYRNGSVDWDAFVLERASTATFERRDPLQLTPVHVTFAGQPMRRWWEFEDSAVNFGALDTAKTDLGKLVLTEFALVSGDDWFVVPLTAEPNTLVRVRAMRVRDCFGQYTYIPPAREPASDPLERWEVFALAPAASTGQGADFLYVPPISGTREESPILEEIRFARDEDANVVFAIEHTVPNQLGEPTGGFAAHLERLRRRRAPPGAEVPAEPEASDEEGAEPAEETLPPPKIEYVLATEVPANWIPFIATDALNVQAGVPQRSVKLQRAAMVSTEGADALRPILGLSRLLQPSEGNRVDWIAEEAVGREGVRVELRRQRMRSATGETYVWLGRKIGVGKGEGRSGLRFDVVRPSGVGVTPE